MTIVDANIVLRYVLDDHEELSSKAAEILENQIVVLPIEAACEVVYVLQKVYQIDKPQIKDYLSKLVNEGLINLENPDVFLKALDCYASKSFDFVDTLLWAYHAVEQHDILTFDVKLNKYIQRTSH